jgi:hypothetical protein
MLGWQIAPAILGSPTTAGKVRVESAYWPPGKLTLLVWKPRRAISKRISFLILKTAVIVHPSRLLALWITPTCRRARAETLPARRPQINDRSGPVLSAPDSLVNAWSLRLKSSVDERLRQGFRYRPYGPRKIRHAAFTPRSLWNSQGRFCG